MYMQASFGHLFLTNGDDFEAQCEPDKLKAFIGNIIVLHHRPDAMS